MFNLWFELWCLSVDKNVHLQDKVKVICGIYKLALVYDVWFYFVMLGSLCFFNGVGTLGTLPAS